MAPITDLQLTDKLKVLNSFYSELHREYAADLDNVNSNDRQSVETFYDKHFRNLKELPLLEWLELFHDSSVATIESFNEFLKERSRTNKELTETVNKWNTTELSLEKLLRDIDDILNSQIMLKDVLSKSAEFAAKKYAVRVICVGTKQGAQTWLSQTKISQIPLLCDDQGLFMKAAHFPRSVWNTVRPDYHKEIVGHMLEGEGLGLPLPMSISYYLIRAALKYAPNLLFGKIMIKDPLSDIHQMGGDVIVDKNGHIIYQYISKTSDDRPSAEDVLESIN